MFGLFKRTKILDWEIALLKQVVSRLEEDKDNLLDQINDNLLKGVLIDMSPIPGYVGFTYNKLVIDQYDNNKGPDYRLIGTKIFDKRTQEWLDYTVYVSTGTINGYSISSNEKCDISLDKVDTSGLRVEALINPDFEKLAATLDSTEIDLLNPSEVYVVSLDNKDYYHIKELEDGDFIGMDLDKNLYRITHDPYEIKMLKEKLDDLF